MNGPTTMSAPARSSSTSSPGGGNGVPNKSRSSLLLSKTASQLQLTHLVPDTRKLQEEDGTDRVLVAGLPDYTRCDNTLITSKYTPWNFLPLTIRIQFRRFANLYFLVVGSVMFVGTYFPHIWASAFSPWTTFGPLSIFISISLLMEGIADYKRHTNDHDMNTYPCVIVEAAASQSHNKTSANKAEEDANTTKDTVPWKAVRLATEGNTRVVHFTTTPRQNIRQGQLVVIRNREMIPTDTVLLATSGDQGCAYIETSSIDGETNLKLRTCAKTKRDTIVATNTPLESMEDAVRRIAHFTALGCFNGDETKNNNNRRMGLLTTEPPNAHINTFRGTLTIPASDHNTNDIENPPQNSEVIPLGAEHLLLRGAVLRNTEWALGMACFTGTDTKLSQNTIEAPTKFSQLDLVTNHCVVVMILIELVIILYLSTMAQVYSTPTARSGGTNLWYLNINEAETTTVPWPYLPQLDPPEWGKFGSNWIQSAMLYVTLLSYFVPLSMYFTLEVVNFFLMYLIYVDDMMYDATTDTIAEPRSTICTDLGQIQYIFSDKTGTLTQNVMRFKRCSIDGAIFGPPVEKTRPTASSTTTTPTTTIAPTPTLAQPFHPLHQVLVGHIHVGGGGVKDTGGGGVQLEPSKGMTFNAELFLRAMSLCHTVVVEKDLDLVPPVDADHVDDNKQSGSSSKLRSSSTSNVSAVKENEVKEQEVESSRSSIGPDGAPTGYAYQAESPDEGALVSEASQTFGFQVISRDSRGIKLKCDHPTLFRNNELVKGLKSGALDPKTIAADSASGTASTNSGTGAIDDEGEGDTSNNIETWSVLAINKFDSTRKRMSILLRAPEEFGSGAILFCKGADSAMLDPEVCTSLIDDTDKEGGRESEWEVAKMLGIQSHLGEFASEGLRTLVLGVRFLTDAQCDAWLAKYNTAAASIKDRDAKLTQCAFEIEKEIHVVGATAIEDKLQKNVPNTIATLAKAGIKLWVLTGDKRETAIEIGYATQVLTPQMHLTEVSDRGLEFVHAQCAMEFMRLVKAGKLPAYQRAEVDKTDESYCFKSFIYSFGKIFSVCFRSMKRCKIQITIFLRELFGCRSKGQQQQLESIDEEQELQKETPNDLKRRRNVRNRAEEIVKRYAEKHPAVINRDQLLSTDELPKVFNRAQSAQESLDIRRSEGKLTGVDERDLKLSQLTAQNVVEQQQQYEADGGSGKPVINDDMLSLRSYYPSDNDKLTNNFDKKKRTVFERMFAVDRDVRKGRLVKHLKREKRKEVLSGVTNHTITPSGDGPRALVIEGAALAHLQGDSELEELVFNIASQCDAVIACRVTPRQKAQLVKLVRHHVEPEPCTLAIGDGANDVGMIHEAHVGIGISGKEGKQAVNASDFSIGQFRFLESLVLYHGRWAYMRTSTVVLFSFYKNAVIAGCLVLYNLDSLYSGTSLFDQWLNSGFSFWAFFPILSLGMFDRTLERSYISKNPEVYQATRQKELITSRTLLRWIVLAICHTIIIYYGQMRQLSGGGGSTTAFVGLMWNKGAVGDGEVSDWQSMGTAIFTSLIILLGYKVMYECRSILLGRWPATSCSKDSEGFLSRSAHTVWSLLIGSYGFYLVSLYILSGLGQIFGANAGTFFNMVSVPQHVLGTSGMNYVLMLFVPIAGIAVDIAGKVFSNLYYPSQTQIHVELEAKEVGKTRRAKKTN